MATISQIQVGNTDYDILDAKSIQWKNSESSPITVSDFDSIVDSGYYSINKPNSASHSPIDNGSNNGILIVYHDLNDSNKPIIIQTYHATSSKIFSRIRSSNGTTNIWGSWRELATIPSSVTMSLQGLIFTGINSNPNGGKDKSLQFFLGSIPKIYGRTVKTIEFDSKVFWWRDLSGGDKYIANEKDNYSRSAHTISKIEWYPNLSTDINLGIRIHMTDLDDFLTTGHLYRATDAPPINPWNPQPSTLIKGLPMITINYN